jgi:hypothetical protein
MMPTTPARPVSATAGEPPHPLSHACLIGAGLGALGVLEVTAGFLAIQVRLPPELPDHFGPAGNADGALPPTQFLVVEVASVLLIALVFVAIIVLGARSPSLRRTHSAALARPLLWLEGSIVAVVIPGIDELVLLRAGGVWAPSAPELSLAFVVVALAPLLAIALVVARFGGGRAWAPTGPATTSVTETPFAGVGNPIELSCASCGRAFVLSSVPLFAPHMGLGGQGSLYVRCPICGVRSWNRVVRRVRP